MVAPLFWVELAVIVYQRYAVHYLVPIPKTVLYPGVPEIWIILSYTVPGTMVNSNAAAAFHLLWLPVLTNRALDERGAGGRRSWYWIASAACCLLGIMLLNSTSAMLCVLIAAPFIAGTKRVSDWVRRRPGLARAVLAGAVSAAVFLILHKIMRTDDGTGHAIPLSSKVSRLGWWLAGLRMFADHPVLGIGPGNFPSAFLTYKPADAPNTLYAHSFPVELLARDRARQARRSDLFFRRLARAPAPRPATSAPVGRSSSARP